MAAKQAAFDAALPARMALVQSVISQYSPQILSDAQHGAGRLSTFAIQVHSTPSSVLESARVARTVAEFMATAERVSAVTPKNALGDAENLVFLAMGPCRIADSRIATLGALVNNVDRGYRNFNNTGQGGTGNCNNSGSPGVFNGSPGAIALNLTITGATHQGFVTVRPPASTNLTSAINFLANQDIANAIVVKMAGTGFGSDDFEARPTLNGPGTAAVHVIFDLLGFYVASEPAALDCIDTATVNDTTGTSPSLETQLSVPACSAGRTRVGISCFEDDDAVLSDFSVELGFCSFIPRAATATPVHASARCCRVPGNTSSRF